MISAQHYRFAYEHPAKEEPDWKTTVDRWYQLDAFAYGLAQAYSIWKPELKEPPSVMILASELASNETDVQFAKQLKESGIASAAKFVHSLPNIRCSSLCQVMNWNGPVICLQKDPFTQVQGLREGVGLLESDPSRHSIWIFSVFHPEPALRQFEAQLFVLTRLEQGASGKHGGSEAHFEIHPEAHKSGHESPLQADRDLREWLGSGIGTLALPGGYQVRKKV